MLEHQQAIGHPDAQGTAGSTFTDHGGDHRNTQAEHLPQVDGDRFTLALLFGLKAGIGPGGIDERENRQAEAIGMIHQPHRFAVSTRSRHPEIAGDVLFGVAAFLMADQHHGSIAHPADTADQGLIVVTATIAVQFNPVVAEHLDEIQRARTLRMTGDLNFLSGSQPLKDLLTPTGREAFQLLKLLRDVDFRISGQLTDLLNLLLQLDERFFELKQGATGHGSGSSKVRQQWPAGWVEGSRC